MVIPIGRLGVGKFANVGGNNGVSSIVRGNGGSRGLVALGKMVANLPCSGLATIVV